MRILFDVRFCQRKKKKKKWRAQMQETSAVLEGKKNKKKTNIAHLH
jgi:hypothetical protein